MYLIGYDLGSSSIKATVMQAGSGKLIASATSPKKEMEIIAQKPGWAEQQPETWWQNIISATQEILTDSAIDPADIHAIGISYQMHGLVLVDKSQKVLRPSIIWCDSRAVSIGQAAAEKISRQLCLEHMLNMPGNFTASKLRWVIENEPEIYKKTYKAMLPGDYIAMKMTGQISTTPSGLSEGIMWDFKKHQLADIVLDNYCIDHDKLPDLLDTFSIQGQLTKQAAQQLGLKAGTKIAYRGGDQPNNALSLNVLNPGEVAATAGTSGVVYGISDQPNYDSKSRVNTFVHVNNKPDAKRYGILLCVNGTGILNSWLKHNVANATDYDKMNELAQQAPLGCDGLMVLPYGNGAERTLGNKDIAASVSGLKFNTHTKSHLFRAAQEGIVFSLNYGLEIMRDMGVQTNTVRAGNANMFLSPLFAQAFASVTGAVIELYNTDGSQGAARGAGIGAGIYKNPSQAFEGLKCIKVIEPTAELIDPYRQAYENWLDVLKSRLDGT